MKQKKGFIWALLLVLGSVSLGNSQTSVKRNMTAGDEAFALEQYVVAVDRYQRALRQEKRDTAKWSIYYKLGQTQQRLNHAKEAYDYYCVLWEKGERNATFLTSYVEVLFNLSMYDEARIVCDTMAQWKLPRLAFFTQCLDRIEENADTLIPLSARDIHYLEGVNTPFSEYGMALVEGDLIISSTRPLVGETTMDPRTGHGYSRLYTAPYRSQSKDWGGVSLLQGPTIKLQGNVGTFSYDSLRNIAYFMWSQANNSGIYTIKRQSNGSWGELEEFELNYDEGKSSFAGRIGHPCISEDGNRLLFVVKDVDLGTSTDIWFVERTPQTQTVKSKKKKSTTSPSRAVQAQQKSKTRPSSRSKKKGNTTVVLNKEWQLPIRLTTSVNTKARESFPQWIDKTTFSFASDGLVGMGGLDLYVASFDTAYKKTTEVMRLPSPINSSFDDHSLLIDKKHKMFLFSSNRYVGPGRTDNIYVCSKTGMSLTVEGDVKDSSSGLALTGYEVYLIEQKGEVKQATKKEAGGFIFPAVGEGNYKVCIQAPGYKSDTLQIFSGKSSSLLPVVMRKELHFALWPNGMLTSAQLRAKAVADSLAALDLDTIPALPLVPAAVPLKDLDTTVAAADTTVAATDTMVAAADTTPVVLGTSAGAADLNPSPYVPFALAVGASGKQDLSVYLTDSMTPKEMIDTINKYRKDIARVDSRYVNDYKNRVNDPLRRAKLQVVPSTAKCEICQDKSRQRETGKPFYIKTNDDKALITMTDNAGNMSYIDLAPNASYSIEIASVNSSGMPSLPKSIQLSDIRKTVVTRDYVLYECMPKLSELNDEVYINNLYFDFDKDSLIKDSRRELDRMIIVAIKNPNMIFEVGAYADERGQEEYNKSLTDRRLGSAVSYIEKKGFDAERIVGKSYGKSKPLIVNAQKEEEHRLNRRVSFRLFNPQAVNELAGKPYPLKEVGPQLGKRVSFKIQLGAFRQPLENPLEYYQDVPQMEQNFVLTYYMDKDGLYKYNLGSNYTDIDQVRGLVKIVLDHHRECYIAAFYDGDRITVAEALAILKHKQK